MKKLIPILFLLISVPVFADTAIPTTPAVADFMITTIRPASYTARTPQCKTDGWLIRAISKDYYNSVMSVVEKWKVDIEASRQLTPAEKKDYDYVKSVFTVEKNAPKAPSWKICDVAMTNFIANIETMATDYSKNKTAVLNDYKTAQMTVVNNKVSTFTSPTLNKVIAVVNFRDVVSNSSVLKSYDLVLKVKTDVSWKVVSQSVMMKNYVVNNKMAEFYGFKIPSVNPLSLQKIFNWYSVSGNSVYTDYGNAAVYPLSQRVGVIYYVEM